jgi:hypothetical protein
MIPENLHRIMPAKGEIHSTQLFFIKRSQAATISPGCSAQFYNDEEVILVYADVYRCCSAFCAENSKI